MDNVTSVLMQQTRQSPHYTDPDDDDYNSSFKDPNDVPRAPVSLEPASPSLQLSSTPSTSPVVTLSPPKQTQPQSPLPTTHTAAKDSTVNNGHNGYISHDFTKVEEEICLANACGNCALAIGSPLFCTLRGVQVAPLNACSDYLSPYALIAQ
jgi:hypothetical protein